MKTLSDAHFHTCGDRLDNAGHDPPRRIRADENSKLKKQLGSRAEIKC